MKANKKIERSKTVGVPENTKIEQSKNVGVPEKVLERRGSLTIGLDPRLDPRKGSLTQRRSPPDITLDTDPAGGDPAADVGSRRGSFSRASETVEKSHGEANGMLIDYICRVAGVKQLLEKGAGSKLLVTVFKRLLTAIAVENFEGYKAACETVNSERIASAIMQEVKRFWKVQGDPVWCADTRSAFREKVFILAKLLNEAKVLKGNVDIWSMQHQAMLHMRSKQDQLGATRRGSKQDQAGEQELAASFWEQYREGHRAEVVVARPSSAATSKVTRTRLMPESRSPSRPEVSEQLWDVLQSAHICCSRGLGIVSGCSP